MRVAIAARSMTYADLSALREQLSLQEPADLRSTKFLRYMMRLSEALNVDLPLADYPHFVTIASSLAYVQRLPRVD